MSTELPEKTTPAKTPDQHQPDRRAEPVDGEESPRLPFAVVGIGASAGGLEAVTEFLEAMRSDSGMAFVLVQHLPPNRESMMADILSKHTTMKVLQVEDGLDVKPNHLYVIRPGHTLTIYEGKLRLGEPLDKPLHNRPVDDFFRSLAEEQRELAIAVVVSGMGSNGSAGAQMVKAVGGLCIAQDPDTAKFPSMPRSLIDGGLADFVLRPRDMPEALIRYAAHPYVTGKRDAEALLRRDRLVLNEVLAVLRARTRQDFNGYKKPTLVRRVQRRMGLHQLTKMSDYARMLRQNPSEVSALADDMMIHVTGFFRDPDAWEALRQRVIVPLIAEREDEGAIRAWVTACSSGEEAYTLGILLLEAVHAANKNIDIKVFATDTADRSLSHARAGVYPGGIESEMTADRIERFFERDDSVYRVKKELRELVVFAPQNVLQDPPFSRLDVCTCRNLLIYLEPEVQRRVLSLLHFGLREGGTLFLGNSETVGIGEELFEPIDKKACIFRRVGPTRHGLIEFPLPHVPGAVGDSDRETRTLSRATLAQLTNRTLLEGFTPPTVVVDRQQRIMFFHGETERYLEQPRGEPTRDVLTLVKEPIRGAVRIALHKAMAQNERVHVRDGVIETAKGPARVEVIAAPLQTRGALPSYFIVSFVEHAEAAVAASRSAPPDDDRHLEHDLKRIRDELQSTIEELQTSNEELKASNEEVTSINEELQSTNEELETSKEELQSLNEELTTANSQLHAKMEELEASTNDLSSLLSSTDIAVIFLDTHFQIRRYTPALKDLFELIPGDIGRPLNDLHRKFSDPDLDTDVRLVLEKLVPREKEVASKTGRWYVRRVLPYRTTDNRINGVVITFIDITERKNAEESLKTSKRAAETANESKDQFLANVSHELRTPLAAILLWAKLFESGKSETPVEFKQGTEVIRRSAEALRDLVEDLLDSSRISAGKLNLDLRETDLASVIRSALDSTLASAAAKGVKIESKLEDVGQVRVDPTRIQQVVWNLLNNAVKFTPAGGRVDVGLSRLDHHVELRVTDSGQGISADFLPHVFDRFGQAKSSGSQLQGGLGLGLAIAKELVELHGGTITARSEGENRGVTFVVRLPLRIKPEAEMPTEPPSSLPSR